MLMMLHEIEERKLILPLSGLSNNGVCVVSCSHVMKERAFIRV
jgi:hypothetical protein